MGYKSDKPHHEYANDALQKLFEDFWYDSLMCRSENYSVDKVFPFTNENLPQIFKDFDFEGKSVLTVGSSGDQMFESIFNGAKRITVADANVCSQPYIELKIAALKNLSYEEASDYFTRESILDWNYYKKISHDLSPKAKEFWDTIMLEMELDLDTRRRIVSKLFHGNFMHKGKSTASFFREKEIYNKIKENVKDCEIDFIAADVTKFESLTRDKYDFIFLSNIFDYFRDRTFFKCIDGLGRNVLKQNGIMQVDYDFDETNFDGKMFDLLLKNAYLANDVNDYIIEKHVEGIMPHGMEEFASKAKGIFLKKDFFDTHFLEDENLDSMFNSMINDFLNKDDKIENAKDAAKAMRDEDLTLIDNTY